MKKTKYLILTVFFTCWLILNHSVMADDIDNSQVVGTWKYAGFLNSDSLSEKEKKGLDYLFGENKIVLLKSGKYELHGMGKVEKGTYKLDSTGQITLKNELGEVDPRMDLKYSNGQLIMKMRDNYILYKREED